MIKNPIGNDLSQTPLHNNGAVVNDASLGGAESYTERYALRRKQQRTVGTYLQSRLGTRYAERSNNSVTVPERTPAAEKPSRQGFNAGDTPSPKLQKHSFVEPTTRSFNPYA